MMRTALRVMMSVGVWSLAFVPAGWAEPEDRVGAGEEVGEDGLDRDVLVQVREEDEDVKGEPGRKRKKLYKKVMKWGGPEGFLGRYKLVWQSLDLSAEQRAKLFDLQQK